ncbi:SGT1-domain-containing protein [Corynespora cassiicola Philippines]|uniref:SGT1-domain-containing protein n=1 Tax=Corynespora cassiicola Philippines TaxID=1448308 RepID=A0A2T2NBE8_CORCC|nr:SGT1-domain-containing protein [Corynespora cassiicola Philippines]
MEDTQPKDGFKWFGEGFDGFPKMLPQDVVEYVVFIIDSRLSDVQTRERLQAFQRAFNALEKKFLREYIWQRDPMKLDLIRENNRWILKGTTNYGESVADEWLIVYFLRELSSEFKDAWIRIYDNDGEFLLIEAANALPKWLNPEVAENRVWINSHRLLIIPLPKDGEPSPLKLEEALHIIRETPARPQQYPKVEKEAFRRLDGYPAAISENQHHATLPLPRKVAHILHVNPSYISPIVEAFYLRDPIAMALIQPEKAKAEIIFAPEDFVEVSVRFTKVLYAQMLHQHWEPPSIWGKALDNLTRKDGGLAASAIEKAQIGIKITAGLEMLVKHKIYADKKAVREVNLLLEDLESGDDTLPTDAEIAAWAKREDDESWLDIDFNDFERELAGKGGQGGFGDKAAQDNLKTMVERFNAFMEDEDAGIDGAKTLDPMDVDDDSDAEDRKWEDPEDSDDEKNDEKNAEDQDSEDDGEDPDADAEYEEYKNAYEKFMTLSAAEKALLTEEARELARVEEAEREEDEEIKKLSEMMEAELFGHGALDLNSKPGEGSSSKKAAVLDKGKGKARAEEPPNYDDDDDDDDDDEILDEDYNLAQNMLKAFKGQAGMAGPAGNLMGMMGVQFPPDADDDDAKGMGKGKGGAKD